MTVKAWLEGNRLDLDHLAQLFPTGDITVMREGDRYYLTSPQIDNPPAGTKNHGVAERLIKLLNGYGSLTHSNFRPVRLSGIYDDETGTTVVPVAAHMEARGALFAGGGIVTDPSGKVEPPPPLPHQPRMALADSNSDVAEALEIMNRIPLGWADLYKVHEIVWRSIDDTNQSSSVGRPAIGIPHSPILRIIPRSAARMPVMRGPRRAISRNAK